MSAIELTSPTATPTSAPVVLKRRHVSASRSAGKFALAATANVSETRNWMLKPLPARIAIAVATRARVGVDDEPDGGEDDECGEVADRQPPR
jgi:hypothetical protein